MIPPKYNFYIGKLDRFMYLSSYVGINNSGEFVSESDKCASGLSALTEGASLFVNMQSLDSYNAVFFYDSSRTFISYKSLTGYNNQTITPPANAKYWAVRFTTADANFVLKKNTKFIYWVQPVKPHYKELNKKYAKENNQEFFRISLDGKLNLFGQDFELVYSSNIEDQHIFLIDKYNRESGKWHQYYKGEFSKTDCKFDYAKKKCELKTSPIDPYNEVMNKYENTYDLIKLAPELTKIDLHKRPLMQVYVLGANSISNFFGGTYWEDEVNEAIDDADALVNKYYFAYIKSGNEFDIKGAGTAEINGVYAGSNGSWDNWNGYTAKFVQTVTALVTPLPSSGVPTVYDISSTSSRKAKTYAGSGGSGGAYNENLYKLRIIKNSTDSVVYESEWLLYTNSPDNIYIDRHDIKMVNPNNSGDTFVISNTFVYHIYQRLLCDVETITDSQGTKTLYDLPSDDFVADNRNYKKCIGLVGGMFFCTSHTVDEPTRYGVNDYGKYFTNKFIPLSTGLGRPLPISRNSWANSSLWYVYDSFYEFWEKKLRKRYTLKDSYSIAAIIKALLKTIDPTLKHEATAEYSRFLYDTATPLNMTRFYVYLTQKTNMLKGDYDQPAQKAETSLAEITKMLRDCFRCYWYIEDGKFKIEHVLFFINGGSYSANSNIQMDFTKLTDQFNKKQLSYFQSEMEYDKSDLAQRYEFSWMDDATELFGGVTLDVNSNYVQKDKVEEINANRFSADVDYMLFNPSAFSDDGFALLCAIPKNFSSESSWSFGAGGSTGVIATRIRAIFKCQGGEVVSVSNIPYGCEVSIGASISEGHALQGITIVSSPWSTGDVTFNAKDSKATCIVVSLKKSDGSEFTSSDIESIKDVLLISVGEALELPIISTSLRDENNDSYTAVAQNWYASWIYLTSRFYIDDMPASSVQSNVFGELYAIPKRCMKSSIEFTAEEDLHELQLIKTDLGNGKVEEIFVNLETRRVKAKLAYSPK